MSKGLAVLRKFDMVETTSRILPGHVISCIIHRGRAPYPGHLEEIFFFIIAKKPEHNIPAGPGSLKHSVLRIPDRGQPFGILSPTRFSGGWLKEAAVSPCFGIESICLSCWRAASGSCRETISHLHFLVTGNFGPVEKRRGGG